MLLNIIIDGIAQVIGALVSFFVTKVGEEIIEKKADNDTSNKN